MIINKDGSIVSPLEEIPVEFFKSKKFGDFYLDRHHGIHDLSIINFDFICVSEHYKNSSDFKLDYVEDVQKTLNFLNDTEYLKLICTKPSNSSVIDILYKTNVLDRGEIKNNISNKRVQAGRRETNRFVEILSKELSDNLIRLYESNLNRYFELRVNKDNFNFYRVNGDSSKGQIIDSINWGIDFMNAYNKKHPNNILLPKDVYNSLFNDNLDASFITKTNQVIENIPIWINPHTDKTIFYYNPYQNTDFNSFNVDKGCIVFVPVCIFAKSMSDYFSDKYHNIYALIDIGFFNELNVFCV